MSQYEYVWNSPGNYIDPFGLLGEVSGVPTFKMPINGIPTGEIPIGRLPIGVLPIGDIPIGGLPIGGLPNGSDGGGFMPGEIGPRYPCMNAQDDGFDNGDLRSNSNGDSNTKDKKPTISQIKKWLKRAHELVGKLPKGKKGKFPGSSFNRGTDKKGYRLDAPDSRRGWHLNIWDYTQGKRRNGGGYNIHLPE